MTSGLGSLPHLFIGPVDDPWVSIANYASQVRAKTHPLFVPRHEVENIAIGDRILDIG